MELSTMWMVSDPKPDSKIDDICRRAATVIEQCGGRFNEQTMIRERWTFHNTESDARKDSEARLAMRAGGSSAAEPELDGAWTPS